MRAAWGDAVMNRPLPGSVFQSLVHFAPDGFFVVDRDGVIVFANAQAETLFGYSREDLVGLPVERLLPERFRARHVDHRVSYARTPRARPMGSRMALKARRRDNSEFDVEISLAPVYTDDTMLVSVTVRDVTDQREAENERRHLLAKAEIEGERNRIAGDLHDGVMQAMYSVGMQLTSFLYDASALTHEERGRINAAIGELNQAIGDARRYVQDLYPAEFDGDLRTSLEDLTRLFAATSGIETSFVSEPLCELKPAVGFELFLLAREALSNVRRHAEASNLLVKLDQEQEVLSLTIRDDGVGFDSRAAVSDGHLGVRSMRRRADAAGARIEFGSAPGAGTEIRVQVPCADGGAAGADRPSFERNSASGAHAPTVQRHHHSADQ